VRPSKNNADLNHQIALPSCLQILVHEGQQETGERHPGFRTVEDQGILRLSLACARPSLSIVAMQEVWLPNFGRPVQMSIDSPNTRRDEDVSHNSEGKLISIDR